MKQNIILPKGDGNRARATKVIMSLPTDKPWMVTIEPYQRRRTEQQNRYLWGVCYATMIQHLPGWRAEDVHEFMLGEHFGWEKLEGLGGIRLRPILGSSRLNKQDFSDHIAFIQQKAAELGIFIPDPEGTT
jgi:hypothetical protein